jgi:ribonucleoside-diphosphate reductase alpha subunit
MSSAYHNFYVINSSEERVPVRFDAITDKLRMLANMEPTLDIIPERITLGILQTFESGCRTRELDTQVIGWLRDRSATHIEYSTLAARMEINHLHRDTPDNILDVTEALCRDASTNRLSDAYVAFIRKYHDRIETVLNYQRDYMFDDLGVRTLKRSYLLRQGSSTGDIIERPQHMYARVALQVRCTHAITEGREPTEDEWKSFIDIYELMSALLISHASPTLFNSGTKNPQMASCFQTVCADELGAIMRSFSDVAMFSKWAGGVSILLTFMRAAGSLIKSTGGLATGVHKFILLLDGLQQYVNQGGLRKGAFAVYLAMYHADIEIFLQLGRLKGPLAVQGENAPNIKYGVMVPDLFMETCKRNGNWYLMCPSECPEIVKTHGADFEAKYNTAVADGRYRKVVKARDLYAELFKTIAETGNPYVIFSDNMNRKCQLSIETTILSSNLCSEITIPVIDNEVGDVGQVIADSTREYGVCNLSAVALGGFVRADKTIDYAGIANASGHLVRNLDSLIDVNMTPVEAGKRSNIKYRPLGIGMIGLADVLAMLELRYDSAEGRTIAQTIAAVMYYGAASTTVELAKEKGSYPALADHLPKLKVKYPNGWLQPDLWLAEAAEVGRTSNTISTDWELDVSSATGGLITCEHWSDLRRDYAAGYQRNSYLMAYMPTASSANIIGQKESFEPITANIFTRKTIAGESVVINKHLVKKLQSLNLWNESMSQKLVMSEGSVATITEIPEDVRCMYSTAREMNQLDLTRMAGAMAPFVCQSMSLNYYMSKLALSELFNIHYGGWSIGLKTGSYYIHSQPASGAQQMMATNTKEKMSDIVTPAAEVCQIGCTSCDV